MTATDDAEGRRTSRRRLTRGDVWRLVSGWLISAAALLVADALLPGLSTEHAWLYLGAAAIAGVLGVVVRPLLVAAASAIGWIAVLVVAIAGQAVIIQLALEAVPGITTDSFGTSLAAAWLTAVVGTVFTWLATSGTPESLSVSLRRSRTLRENVTHPGTDGVVFVQFDGLAYPVALWALQAGLLPNLRRWLDSGTHRLQEWTVQMPCTTPASQLGILHGTCDGVPAFRWFDRELGRVVVSNRPADAQLIEARASNGRGLLADGGISVSNLFSGDAPRASMTMSRMNVSRGSVQTRRAFAWFMVRPDGLARSLSRLVAEVTRERYQARRQRHLDVLPRVPRPWSFTAVRGVSNGLLRDMNTAVVAAEMMSGTPSVYVDYVDYDEVAHHAGPTRLESLAVLTQLDEVLGILEDVAEAAPKRYHLVVLSDHGQALGQPFADRYDQDLATLCADLMSADVAWVGDPVEGWGRVESLVGDVAGTESAGDRLATRARERSGRDEPLLTTSTSGAVDGPGLVVLGSGNLGLFYTGLADRLTLTDLQERWPRLVPGLVAHPGIAFVTAMTTRGPVAIGAEGAQWLRTGEIEGNDPLAAFGAHAAGVLEHAASMPKAPDLYVNSALDPDTLEVNAFEGLVGSHGGLGGWQDRGMLIAPAGFVPDDAVISGAVELHHILVSMLERVGQRGDLAVAVEHTT